MDLPKNLGQRDFKWFKKYYKLTIEGQVTETVEEVYVMLGGKLPKKSPTTK